MFNGTSGHRMVRSVLSSVVVLGFASVLLATGLVAISASPAGAAVPVSLVLSSVPNPPVTGNNAYTVTLTTATSGAAPTGDVVLTDSNGKTCTTAPFSSTSATTYTATCTISSETAAATLTASYSDLNYTSTSSNPLIVAKAALVPLVLSSVPNSPVTGNNAYTITLTTPSGGAAPSGDVVLTDSNNKTCTTGIFSGSGTTYTATCTISSETAAATLTASYSDLNYTSTSSNTLTVAKAAQATLVVNSTSATYPYSLTLTTVGGSGQGTVSYIVAGGTASGCANVSGTLTATSAGTCLITATKAADSNYLSASSVQTTVTFSLAAQATLVVNSTSATYPYSLVLTTTGGLGGGAVSYTVTDGTASGCANASGTLTATSAGTCLVTATKAADSNYASASSVQTTVTFSLAAQVTLVVNSMSATYGSSLVLTTTGGSGAGAVSYTVTNGTASGCANASGTLTATSAGTCLVTATKAADSNYASASSAQTTVTFTTVSTLQLGAIVTQGHSLVSADGLYSAVLQGDGNFVVYGPTGAIWWTGTNNSAPTTLVLQADGNLVLYGPAGHALWYTSTNGGGPTGLVMQNDGNLVLYGTTGALWSSKTGKL